jgi:hypothetical protein
LCKKVLKMPERTHCDHLDDILRAEIPIIKRHIERHKWYRHIPDTNSAMIDFIENYGFIMREMYCQYVCPGREECPCPIYKKPLPPTE